MSGGLGISFERDDLVSSVMERLENKLENRQDLNSALAHGVRNLVTDHLNRIANDRHDTAEKLGAEITKHWDDPASYTSEYADEERGTVSIHKPGIGRAAHDVKIEPSEGKEWLTIPLLAEVYGQRAYRVPDLFFVQPKGKDYALLGRREGSGKEAEVSWLYLLVESVLQPQDRTLLPTDDEFIVRIHEELASFLDYTEHRAQQGGEP